MFAHINVIGNAFHAVHDCQKNTGNDSNNNNNNNGFEKTIDLGTRGNCFPRTV